MQNPRIIVIGNSYSAASVYYYLQKLVTKFRRPVSLLFIASKNYYSTPSMLPELLVRNCDYSDIGGEIRDIGYITPDINIIQSEIESINLNKKVVKVDGEDFSYDSLVFAPENDLFSSDIKVDGNQFFKTCSVEDYIVLKKQIDRTLYKATREKNADVRKTLLSFSIIGANKKGIGLACSISDYVDELIKRQYPQLNKAHKKVNLIDKNKTINASENAQYSNYVFHSLSKRDVRIYLHTTVDRVVDERIQSSNNTEIYSSTIIYSGGNNDTSLKKKLPKEFSLLVDNKTKSKKHDGLFIIGEVAENEDLVCEKDNAFYRQESNVCAKNVFAELSGNELATLELNNKTEGMFLGRKDSVFLIGKYSLIGYFGWFANRLICIWDLIGKKKKITAIINLLLNSLKLKDYSFIDLKEENAIKKVKKELVNK